MGSRNFKNELPLRDKSYGLDRRQDLTKEELNNSSPLPNPITYEDIDKEFKKWVEEEILISFDGKRIPTFALFSNQRFSEYLQTWEHVDRDKNDRKYYIDYRMKQPMGVDFHYTVSIMTNRYELLNQFNQIINDKFKSITAYLRVNGHFVSMILEGISDESQYNIDDRQFYSQSCEILLRSYIIQESDLIVEEVPSFKFLGFDGEDAKKSYAEIEELPCQEPENPYYYKPLLIRVSLATCDDKIKFTMDCDFTVEEI